MKLKPIVEPTTNNKQSRLNDLKHKQVATWLLSTMALCLCALVLPPFRASGCQLAYDKLKLRRFDSSGFRNNCFVNDNLPE